MVARSGMKLLLKFTSPRKLRTSDIFSGSFARKISSTHFIWSNAFPGENIPHKTYLSIQNFNLSLFKVRLLSFNRSSTWHTRASRSSFVFL